MHIAVQGALWGLGLGVFLVYIEYAFVKKAVVERAVQKHRKPEFEGQDRNRIRAVVTFALCLPFAFALGAWLLWG
jgi:hypothetical protein